jgi:hypothetical protein
VLLILPELDGVATYVGYLPCASTRPCEGGIHATIVGRSGIVSADPRSGHEDGESRTCAQSVWSVSGHPNDSVSTSTNHDLGRRKEIKGHNTGAYTPDDLLDVKFSVHMIGIGIVTKRKSQHRGSSALRIPMVEDRLPPSRLVGRIMMLAYGRF